MNDRIKHLRQVASGTRFLVVLLLVVIVLCSVMSSEGEGQVVKLPVVGTIVSAYNEAAAGAGATTLPFAAPPSGQLLVITQVCTQLNNAFDNTNIGAQLQTGPSATNLAILPASNHAECTTLNPGIVIPPGQSVICRPFSNFGTFRCSAIGVMTPIAGP